ncbi:PTS IIA-like nitrogen regulatory protein PtsN [Kaustia mangrovi]|uniref:PTS IIA-like nitrogen regulatory protein PtsN n=1 Tax=Kaustia mangrovi TaxID=2593653 RepID=A0A7S8C3D5_9HYPH|nr:PTS IIA-like nitrogen regulatory protein PtsN [Kaustia mangrovi]QPC42577.1 PTS IIA-like nitrogen regulatory protein PtsN [Kaustia mangrovi]
MVQLSDILPADGIVPSLKASSKKQALQELSQLAGRLADLDTRTVFETLLQRERLGSTGLGQGIAIPHGKFAGLDRLYGVFARLAHPIEFDAVDDQPVDLVFLLLAPESAGADHLKALARISRLLRDPAIVAKLRGSDSAGALYSILTEPAASASHAA